MGLSHGYVSGWCDGDSTKPGLRHCGQSIVRRCLTVTETIETPTVTADPEIQTTETETPATESVVERAAPEAEAAAAPAQVEVTEPEKPNYITREEWERERADVARKAAADAIESDRRRRQTENARKAAQEKRDLEDRAELIDTVKATFGAKGIYEVPDDAVISAIDRTVRKRSDQLRSSALEDVDMAWDWLTAPAYGKEVELAEQAEAAARRLGPKVQHLVDQLRPAIEEAARKGYISESEIPARVEAEITRRNAQKREGTEELKRPEGQPSPDTSTVAERLDRIGTSRETPADRQWWNDREKARGRG